MGAIITATTGCSGISIPRKIIPTWAFRACVTLVAAMLVAPVLSVEGQQTCIERDLQYRLDGDDLLWHNVRAVSTDDHNLFALTQSSPRIHRFDLSDGNHLLSWGQRGQGPGEFQSSSGITLVGEHVYVLDSNQGRLSIFELMGDLVRTIPLQRFGMPPNFPSWLDRATGDTVLFGLSVPMGNERSIIARSFGASASEDPIHQDTVIVFPARTASLRLAAPGAPSLTLSPPYSPKPQWTPVSGGVAFWQGLDSDIRILGLDGVLKSAISLTLDDRFEVTSEDKEFWLQDAIPQEFLGQRPFEPLREKARRTVDFPRYHPLMSRILGGPDNLLWVRRTPDGRDQVWDVVDTQGQLASRVSLASGQALMSVIPGHLVLKVTDDLGVESIEVYRCRTLPTGGSP
ncbi:MAG: hypothetical protein F4183_06000 [Rhodothermaceae bacterium]|nr:hypothetical protein [Rhodothermaceae bacterium]